MTRQPEQRHLERERQTVEAMIEIYCAEQHGGEDLCPECDTLRQYAYARLTKCPYQEEKPTCANCRIHCYKPEMRARIREVMRYAGPRMLLKHPVQAIRHLLDGRREGKG